MTEIDIKPGWRALPCGIGTLTIIVFTGLLALRAASMLGPSALRPLFIVMCLLMVAVPWLLLSARGRGQIGLRRPVGAGWAWRAVAVGSAWAALGFGLGMGLFQTGPDNWYLSVARSYGGHPMPELSLWQLYLIFTIPACLFSPIGEEIFFRGYLQKLLERYGSRTTATHVQSSLFALVHLLHHGLLANSAGLVLLPLSGTLWMALMFGLSWSLAWLRARTDSIYPAILGHAAFNATMNAFIFAFLYRNGV